MKILLHTGGSYGDISPFIPLGKKLQDLGHEVIFVLPENNLKDVADFHAIPYVNVMDVDFSKNEDFIFPILDLLMNHSMSFLPKMIEICSGIDLIISHPLCPMAKIISDYYCIPKVDLLISPKYIKNNPSSDAFLNSYWLECLNERRYALGLPKDSYTSLSPLRNDNLKITLFPKKIYDSGDHENLVYGNFMQHYDQSGLPIDMQNFIDAGTPPVVYTLGYGIGGETKPKNFLDYIIEVASSGIRSIVLGDVKVEHENVFVCNETLAHHLLFPQSRAVVNHGGIGTIAKCLESNTPQIIVPQMQENSENSEYFSHFCAVIQPEEFTSTKLLDTLDRDFYDYSIGLEYSNAIKESDGLETIIKTLQTNKYIDGRDIKIS